MSVSFTPSLSYLLELSSGLSCHLARHLFYDICGAPVSWSGQVSRPCQLICQISHRAAAVRWSGGHGCRTCARATWSRPSTGSVTPCSCCGPPPVAPPQQRRRTPATTQPTPPAAPADPSVRHGHRTSSDRGAGFCGCVDGVCSPHRTVWETVGFMLFSLSDNLSFLDDVFRLLNAVFMSVCCAFVQSFYAAGQLPKD